MKENDKVEDTIQIKEVFILISTVELLLSIPQIILLSIPQID